jgi:GT2 family glycosyltransferase
MSRHPHVVVLVISWHRADLTTRCVQALARLDYPSYELVVVENGGAAAAASLRRQLPGVVLLPAPDNLGFAGGSNLGLAYALDRGADYVLLLNNDTAVPSGALSALVELAQANPEIGFLSPTIRYLDAPHRLWFRGARFRPDLLLFEHLDKDCELPPEEPGDGAPPRVLPTDYACGCAILARRAALQRVGLFDPRYFLFYEDADLGARARAQGIECAVAARVEIQHQVSASFGGTQTPRHAYYGLRNALLYAELHLSRLDYLRLLEHSIRVALAPLRDGRKGQGRLAGRGLGPLVKAPLEPCDRARLLGLRDYVLRRFGKGPATLAG